MPDKIRSGRLNIVTAKNRTVIKTTRKYFFKLFILGLFADCQIHFFSTTCFCLPINPNYRWALPIMPLMESVQIQKPLRSGHKHIGAAEFYEFTSFSIPILKGYFIVVEENKIFKHGFDFIPGD
jgi:hypothetical protein